MVTVFRLLGDLSHVISIFLLLLKIKTSKSCVGTCWDEDGKGESRVGDGVLRGGRLV